MRTRISMATVAVGILVWFLSSVLAQEGKSTSGRSSFVGEQGESIKVRKIAAQEPDDDLASFLHVRKFTGEFDLEGRTPRIFLGIEFYRGGKQLGPEIRSGQVLTKDLGNPKGRFSICIADLDYLRLKGAKKSCLRFHTTLFMESEGLSMSLSSSSDLSKSIFDPEWDLAKDSLHPAVLGGGTFEPVPEKGRIPLFWRAVHKGSSRTSVTGQTAKQVIANYPEDNLMIVYLVTE